MKFPQIGELLPNGHIVDAAYCVGEDRYVLAHRDGAPEPYVVWAVDQDGDTRNGRYFTDLTRAQRYFASRCYDWMGMCSPHSQQLDCQTIRSLICRYGIPKSFKIDEVNQHIGSAF